MQIIWSKNAQITFEAVVVYLEDNFGVKSVDKIQDILRELR